MKRYHVTKDGHDYSCVFHNGMAFQTEFGKAWTCLYCDAEPLPFQFSMVREGEGENRQTTSIVLSNGETSIDYTVGVVSLAMAINIACNMIRRALPVDWQNHVYQN